MASSCAKSPVVYREYQFADSFRVLLMHQDTCFVPGQVDFLHFHNTMEFALCEQGSMLWNLEGEERHVSEGDICILPPFFTHSSCFPPQEGSVYCYYLTLDPDKVLAPLHPDGLPSELRWYQSLDFPKVLSGEKYGRIRRLLSEIILLLRDPAGEYRPKVIGLTEAFMVELYRLFRDCPSFRRYDSPVPALIPAVNCLNESYAMDPDPAVLAQRCGMSTSRFQKMFRDAFHQTPLQYARYLRVQRACHLLTSTERSIVDIAFQVGFTSVSSFNRHFAALMGCSPQAYRNGRRSINKQSPIYAPYHTGS